MKFTVATKNFMRIINIAQKAIKKGSTMPVLQNFLFGWDKDRNVAFAKAANTEYQLSLVFEILSQQGDFTPFLVSARELTDIVSTMNADTLSFDVDMSTHVVKVDYLTGTFSIPCLESNDFPSFVLGQEKMSLSCDAPSLCAAVAASLPYVGANPLRPVLSSVALDVKADGITVVSTDGRSMYKQNMELGAPLISSGNPQLLAVPEAGANLLVTAFSKAKDLEVCASDTKIQFRSPGVELVAAMTEDKYPHYNSVIPSSQPNAITLNLTQVKCVVKRLLVFVSSLESCTMSIELTDGGLLLSGRNWDKGLDCEEKMPFSDSSLTTAKSGFKIGVNARTFSQVLNSLHTEDFIFEFSDTNHPVTVRENAPDSSILMLLMPVILND